MNSKHAILALLEANRGIFLSGEEIAGGLGISRNAVWKAVGALRSEGYRIEAVTRRGYRLAGESDVLSVEGLMPYLAEGVDPEKIFIYPTLVSTNRTAKEMALRGAPHGTCVIADAQTGGKGRKNRDFYSPSGGIYLSALLLPDCFPCADPKAVTAHAAVSVIRTLSAAGLEAGIRPVNDIYIAGKKVCGILTESGADFENGELQWIVVGVGINYTLDASRLTEELRERAGALFPKGGETVSRNRIIARLINELLTGFSGKTREDLLAEYDRFVIRAEQDGKLST